MARPLRIEYPGAWYHVMNRGAGRKKVFKTTDQRQRFLSLLSETAERFNAEWHAYCLMGNHYHLLVRTPEGNLQRIMRHVNGVYTQYFNSSERRDGALFRGRYRAILVEAEAHWLELSRYIHRNPLEAGFVADLSDYPWSSYRAYVGLDPVPDWLTTEYILKGIGKRSVKKRYQAFVAGDTDEALARFYRQAKASPILGSDAFKAQVLAGQTTDIDRPALRAARALPSVDHIVACTCRRLNVPEEEIWQPRRGRAVRSEARPIAMYLCQRVGAMTLSQIAQAFGLKSYAGAGTVIREARRRIGREPELGQAVEQIESDLTRP